MLCYIASVIVALCYITSVYTVFYIVSQSLYGAICNSYFRSVYTVLCYIASVIVALCTYITSVSRVLCAILRV